jgi:hypothetical protein
MAFGLRIFEIPILKGKNKVVVNFPFYIENNIHMAGLPYFNMY